MRLGKELAMGVVDEPADPAVTVLDGLEASYIDPAPLTDDLVRHGVPLSEQGVLAPS